MTQLEIIHRLYLFAALVVTSVGGTLVFTALLDGNLVLNLGITISVAGGLECIDIVRDANRINRLRDAMRGAAR